MYLVNYVFLWFFFAVVVVVVVVGGGGGGGGSVVGVVGVVGVCGVRLMEKCMDTAIFPKLSLNFNETSSLIYISYCVIKCEKHYILYHTVLVYGNLVI